MNINKYLFLCMTLSIISNIGAMEEEGGLESLSPETSSFVLRNSLKDAVGLHDKVRIKSLVQAGANPDIPVHNPLLYALQRNDLDLIKFLLAHGAQFGQRLHNEPWQTVADYIKNPSRELDEKVVDFIQKYSDFLKSGKGGI